MGQSKDSLLWTVIRRKLFRSSQSDGNTIFVLHTNNESFSSRSTAPAASDFVSREDLAAITIQACFRSHLATRAYKALRSLVRLQAIVRGVVVRRQARMALHCMHALTRLQITVRARQLLLINN
ncbi:protein iq-domain 1 [Phtheirospermum japonicum]|uniref:Protein iq-domain 1 n=1 Tax=Phtheirospermum japonicum TaxID=374723 RepID=A0A830BWA0_9LAMI|nr:protein iq-domain 1 [Phtheirospermum japonicum]